MKHRRPEMSELPPNQQSRSFNGLLSHLSRQINAMVRTAQSRGWPKQRTVRMVRQRAGNLRTKASGFDQLANGL
jgi:hypothetical protein